MNPIHPFSIRRLVQGLLLALLAFAVMPARAQYMYFSQQLTQGGLNYIGRADLDGNNLNKQWLRTQASPAGITLDPTFIYWASESGQQIGRANFTTPGLYDDSDPATYNKYWADTQGQQATGGTASFVGNVMTLVTAPTIGSVKLLQTVAAGGLPNPATGQWVVIDSLIFGDLNAPDSQYLLRDNTIGNARASFSGTVMTITKIPDSYSFSTMADGQYVTAAGVPPGTIITYNSGGTGIGTLNSTYNLTTVGLVPVNVGTISDEPISTAAFPASIATESFTARFSDSRPIGVAQDGTYLYWTESPEPATAATPRICRVPLANPANSNDVPWIYLPQGAAPWQIVSDGTYVYWAEQTLYANQGSICRAAVGVPSGTAGIRSVLSTPVNAPTGVAVNSTHIFWASANDNTINILHKDGSAVATSGDFPKAVTQSTQLYSLAANNNVFYGGLNIGNITFGSGHPVESQLLASGVDASTIATDGSHPIYGMAINGVGTVVTLTSFKATPTATQVLVGWATGSEVDTAGFNVLRSTSATGTFTKLNAAIISAKGSGVSGATYSWTDTSVNQGDTYYYQLEDIDTKGTSTLHGPVSATVGATSPILSFQGTPSDIFLGGSSLLSWTVNGTPSLSISGIGPVSASSLAVSPLASTSYVLSDTQGNQSMTTVNVKPFGLLDLPGLAKAWGSKKGDATYNPSYDLNGDGKVDDADVALCFKGL